MKLEHYAIRRYLRLLPDWFLPAVDKADIVILESGLPIVLAELVKTRKPEVWLAYNASDDLKTIGAGQAVVELLYKNIHLFDLIRLPSKLLVPLTPESTKIAVIPHGFDRTLLSVDTPSPYEPGQHIVSLGSMLFDPSFFQIAAPEFPNATFHLIGVGSGAQKLTQPNVRVYPPMRHADTIAYIKYADVGVAPYRVSERAAYLADTSMKLKQFAAFGLPSVCPRFACGDEPSRIAYQPSDPASIVDALTRALQLDRRPSISLSTWADVVDAMLPGAEPPSMGRS